MNLLTRIQCWYFSKRDKVIFEKGFEYTQISHSDLDLKKKYKSEYDQPEYESDWVERWQNIKQTLFQATKL